VREIPVRFANDENKSLAGILHMPEAGGPVRFAVNLVNPGIKNRVAPNRLNVKLARRLCGLGYPVLRFDPAGVGESEGELPETGVKNIWGLIQSGLFIRDISAANELLREETGAAQILIAGVCGGAISALLASEKETGISGLILVDVPVIVEGDRDFAASIVPGAYADLIFYKYMKKLVNPKAWLRVIALRSDFRAIARSIRVKVRGDRFFNEKGHDRQKAGADTPALNPLYLRAYRAFLSGRGRVLFALSENDAGTPYFENLFEKAHLDPEKKKEDGWEIIKVKHANHIYAFKEWQEQLMGGICDWVTSNFSNATL
jgi:pimeloyl-ACP methyl ester carboxylesterase